MYFKLIAPCCRVSIFSWPAYLTFVTLKRNKILIITWSEWPKANLIERVSISFFFIILIFNLGTISTVLFLFRFFAVQKLRQIINLLRYL